MMSTDECFSISTHMEDDDDDDDEDDSDVVDDEGWAASEWTSSGFLFTFFIVGGVSVSTLGNDDDSFSDDNNESCRDDNNDDDDDEVCGDDDTGKWYIRFSSSNGAGFAFTRLRCMNLLEMKNLFANALRRCISLHGVRAHTTGTKTIIYIFYYIKNPRISFA